MDTESILMVVRWDEGVRERVKRGLKITIGSYRIVMRM